MALFMDTHTLEGGVSAADVAAAHQADLATQGAHGVDYLRYWVDPMSPLRRDVAALEGVGVHEQCHLVLSIGCRPTRSSAG